MKTVYTNLVIVTIFVGAYILGSFGAAVSCMSNQNAGKVPLLVLMYHNITAKPALRGKYCVTVQEFENDLKYLQNNGYTPISVKQLTAFAHNSAPLPDRPVIITFDDGYGSFYTYAYPLLEKYDFKAVVNNVGSFTEKYTILEEQNHPDCHNPDYCYLTLSEITKMSESGRVEMGCHTYDMHSLGKRKGCGRIKNESPEAYEASLTEDIEKYRRIMPYSTSIFAYPYGIYSKESPSILRKLGFTAVFDCTERMNYIDDKNIDWLFNIHRYNRPSGISSESFFAKIQ